MYVYFDLSTCNVHPSGKPSCPSVFQRTESFAVAPGVLVLK